MHQQILFYQLNNKRISFGFIMFLAAARGVLILMFIFTGEVNFLLMLLVSCLLGPTIICVTAVGQLLADLLAVAYALPSPDLA